MAVAALKPAAALKTFHTTMLVTRAKEWRVEAEKRLGSFSAPAPVIGVILAIASSSKSSASSPKAPPRHMASELCALSACGVRAARGPKPCLFHARAKCLDRLWRPALVLRRLRAPRPSPCNLGPSRSNRPDTSSIGLSNFVLKDATRVTLYFSRGDRVGCEACPTVHPARGPRCH
jgi:hypothetical protein